MASVGRNLLVALLILGHAAAFVAPIVGAVKSCREGRNIFGRNRLEDDIEKKSRENAQGGAAETAAGAILGGLVLGPFGALFGASMGANLGAQRAVDRARKEEMAKMGVTDEMLQMAQECGAALERSIEGLTLTRDSYETQRNFARRLDSTAEDLYERAKRAMTNDDEDTARKLLLERQNVQEKLKKALLACVEEKERLEKMERNVEALEQRALEVESLLNRSVGAKSLQENSLLSLGDNDPLLRKFQDMGID